MTNSNANAPSYTDSLANTSANFSLQLTGRVDGSEDSATKFGPQYHGQVRVTIILIMIAFSATGNSVVCWRLLRNRRHHRYQKAHVLFLNLAMADLLVTTVTMTSQTVWEIMGRAWIAGDTFCRIFKVLQTFALASSTYVIVAIALDRHFAIVHPLASCPTPSRLATAAWVASLLPSLPNLYVFRLVDAGAGIKYCTSLFYANKMVSPLARQLYMTSVFMAVFVLPLILLVVLYGRIIAEIWHQSSAIKNRHQTTSSLPKAKVKTVKLTAAIFAAFLVTNVPYMIQELALAFAGSSVSLDRNVVALFGVISASNSAINPFIFLFFQKKSSSAKGRRRFVMPFRRDTVAESKNGTTFSSCRNSGAGHDRYTSSPKSQSTIYTISSRETNRKSPSSEQCADLNA
ncbi:hypothetical protein HPB51_008265 [Rhipicephalus microplus]|uniref:G-protein coupled receptors family 1 profile domain-containing protein n=1 Tax=Rhipicephalus microplus TaxID=6941 RepID=A0A9J6F0B8_RHIMP|nr:vasopressin V1a receptor-like [Rhipicephalus microplus]KAH8039672.1 hypothetical protein HPB51_008265 [Rhipicephalus microplus]